METNNDELFHSHARVDPQFRDEVQLYGMHPSRVNSVIATPYIVMPAPSAKSEVAWESAGIIMGGNDSVSFSINTKQSFLRETWLVQKWPALRLKRERADRHEAIAWAPNFATMRVKTVEFKVDNEPVHQMTSLAIKAQNEVIYPLSDEAYREATGQLESLISFDRDNNTRLHSYTTHLPQRVCYDAANPFPVGMFNCPVTQMYSLAQLTNMLILRTTDDQGVHTYRPCPSDAIEMVSGGEIKLELPQLVCGFSTMDKEKLAMTLLSMKHYNFMFKPIVLIDNSLSRMPHNKLQIGNKTTDIPLRQLIVAAESCMHSAIGSEMILTCDDVGENVRRSPLTVLNESNIGGRKLVETMGGEICNSVSFINTASTAKGSVTNKGWHVFKFHNDFKGDFYDTVRDTRKNCDIYYSLRYYDSFGEQAEAQDRHQYNVYLLGEAVKFLVIKPAGNGKGFIIESIKDYCTPPLPLLKE